MSRNDRAAKRIRHGSTSTGNTVLRVTAATIAGVLGFVLVGGTMYWENLQHSFTTQDISALVGDPTETATVATPTASVTADAAPVDAEAGNDINILLIGSDSRAGANGSIGGKVADTFNDVIRRNEELAGELARTAGLPVPEIVLIELDAELARTEPDSEIQELMRASAGLNLALDYLPGSVTFDPLAHEVDAALASRIVWHDAFTSNVDRSARNTNLLVWHRGLWLIDHGASLIFHHDWRGYMERSTGAFPMIRDHVLLPQAAQLAEADAAMSALLGEAEIERVVALIPDAWLADEPAFASVAEHRNAYGRYLLNRLRQPHAFVEEADRARSLHL